MEMAAITQEERQTPRGEKKVGGDLVSILDYARSFPIEEGGEVTSEHSPETARDLEKQNSYEARFEQAIVERGGELLPKGRDSREMSAREKRKENKNREAFARTKWASVTDSLKPVNLKESKRLKELRSDKEEDVLHSSDEFEKPVVQSEKEEKKKKSEEGRKKGRDHQKRKPGEKQEDTKKKRELKRIEEKREKKPVEKRKRSKSPFGSSTDALDLSALETQNSQKMNKPEEGDRHGIGLFAAIRGPSSRKGGPLSSRTSSPRGNFVVPDPGPPSPHRREQEVVPVGGVAKKKKVNRKLSKIPENRFSSPTVCRVQSNEVFTDDEGKGTSEVATSPKETYFGGTMLTKEEGRPMSILDFITKESGATGQGEDEMDESEQVEKVDSDEEEKKADFIDIVEYITTTGAPDPNVPYEEDEEEDDPDPVTVMDLMNYIKSTRTSRMSHFDRSTTDPSTDDTDDVTLMDVLKCVASSTAHLSKLKETGASTPHLSKFKESGMSALHLSQLKDNGMSTSHLSKLKEEKDKEKEEEEDVTCEQTSEMFDQSFFQQSPQEQDLRRVNIMTFIKMHDQPSSPQVELSNLGQSDVTMIDVMNYISSTSKADDLQLSSSGESKQAAIIEPNLPRVRADSTYDTKKVKEPSFEKGDVSLRDLVKAIKFHKKKKSEKERRKNTEEHKRQFNAEFSRDLQLQEDDLCVPREWGSPSSQLRDRNAPSSPNGAYMSPGFHAASPPSSPPHPPLSLPTSLTSQSIMTVGAQSTSSSSSPMKSLGGRQSRAATRPYIPIQETAQKSSQPVDRSPPIKAKVRSQTLGENAQKIALRAATLWDRGAGSNASGSSGGENLVLGDSGPRSESEDENENQEEENVEDSGEEKAEESKNDSEDESQDENEKVHHEKREAPVSLLQSLLAGAQRPAQTNQNEDEEEGHLPDCYIDEDEESDLSFLSSDDEKLENTNLGFTTDQTQRGWGIKGDSMTLDIRFRSIEILFEEDVNPPSESLFFQNGKLRPVFFLLRVGRQEYFGTSCSERSQYDEEENSVIESFKDVITFTVYDPEDVLHIAFFQKSKGLKESSNSKRKGFLEIGNRAIKLAPLENQTASKEITLFEFPEMVNSMTVRLTYSYGVKVEKGILRSFGFPCESLATRLNTGDIILFSTYRLLSAGTRFFTRSKWDHVAVVVVMNDVPMLLEVTNPCGVEVAPATNRLLQYRKHSDIGIRRLRWNKGADGSRIIPDQSDLVKFVLLSNGSKYDTNAWSLFKAVVARENKDPKKHMDEFGVTPFNYCETTVDTDTLLSQITSSTSTSTSPTRTPPHSPRTPPNTSPHSQFRSPLPPPLTTSPPLVSPPLVSPPLVSPPLVSPPLVSPPLVSPPLVSPPLVSDSIPRGLPPLKGRSPNTARIREIKEKSEQEEAEQQQLKAGGPKDLGLSFRDPSYLGPCSLSPPSSPSIMTCSPVVTPIMSQNSSPELKLSPEPLEPPEFSLSSTNPSMTSSFSPSSSSSSSSFSASPSFPLTCCPSTSSLVSTSSAPISPQQNPSFISPVCVSPVSTLHLALTSPSLPLPPSPSLCIPPSPEPSPYLSLNASPASNPASPAPEAAPFSLSSSSFPTPDFFPPPSYHSSFSSSSASFSASASASIPSASSSFSATSAAFFVTVSPPSASPSAFVSPPSMSPPSISPPSISPPSMSPPSTSPQALSPLATSPNVTTSPQEPISKPKEGASSPDGSALVDHADRVAFKHKKRSRSTPPRRFYGSGVQGREIKQEVEQQKSPPASGGTRNRTRRNSKNRREMAKISSPDHGAGGSGSAIYQSPPSDSGHNKKHIPKNLSNKFTADDPQRYFCSQLVMQCYQELGLLPMQMKARKWLPKDFARDEMNLIGARLAPILMFNKL